MSFLGIPTTTNPQDETAYTTTISLEGRDYVFAFQYVQRLDEWILTVATAEGDPILAGVPIVAGVNLLAGCADERRPPGALYLVPGDATPGLEELGEGRLEALQYATSDEVANL